MYRPGSVGDAIAFDDNGIPFGKFSDFTLRSAYQPIYKVASNTTLELHGFEGLLRVTLGDQPVDTKAFLDSVLPEDRMFIEMMCCALHIRSYTKSETSGKTLFLNINAGNFPSAEIAESEMYYTFSQLARNGLSRGRVVYELHNSAVATPYVLTRLCEMFKGNGFEFALDDFGVAHSSIERYVLLRPNIIKINRNLFLSSEHFQKVESLMASLVNTFKEHGASVLMDCIETDQHLISALEMEVNLLQGYHLSKPQLHPVKVENEIVVKDAFKIPKLSVVSQ
ncbi:MAG: EAL domain-containing protein [Rhizobiaceae bacterium]|nr:EAL domain-containing protein [Rhizobiaceae bacterium]